MVVAGKFAQQNVKYNRISVLIFCGFSWMTLSLTAVSLSLHYNFSAIEDLY